MQSFKCIGENVFSWTLARLRLFLLCVACLLMSASTTASAQQNADAHDVQSSSTVPEGDNNVSELSSQEVLTFKKQVSLVIVPVVVRDKDGKAVGWLTREDFQIFDDGKLQPISTFTVEINKSAGERNRTGTAQDSPTTEKVLGTNQLRFFAYLFDDIHLHAGDLMQVRAAAKKHLESGTGLDDRGAIFTTSGEITQEFTNDKAQLSQAMDRIKPGFAGGGSHCPYMNYYLAQKIVAEFGASSHPAWDGATDDAWMCLFNRAEHLQTKAADMALDAARREVQEGHANTQRSLLSIETVLRRLAATPGPRTLILVSPGFQTDDDHTEQNSAITLATGRNIVINALDASGLYTGVAGADESEGPSTPMAAQLEDPINRQGRLMQTNVMAELAEGTGGKFFHDSNDLKGGFDQLASAPEYVYLLAFIPQTLKHKGRYHHLKIVPTKNHGWTVQARRGYYEASGADNSEKAITEELQRALFSREEVRTVPIALRAEYSKKDGRNRELSVTAHMETSGVHFQKLKNMNVDELTVVCGLFDINGNYLQGKKLEISLRLTDDTLRQVTNGVNVKTTFDVEPGAYLIRVVVRDSSGQLLSAVNGAGVVE